MSDMDIDLNRLRLYSLADRQSKVDLKMFAKPHNRGDSFDEFFSSLPGVLGADILKKVVSAVKLAYTGKKQVIFAMGAHVIKCGLAPLVIDLMNRGIVTGIALNGAGIIHDFELAYMGQTSEDVGKELDNGNFGMARETGEMLNWAIIEGVSSRCGIGESVGKLVSGDNFAYNKFSILASCYKLGIPATVHVAIGTDIIHMHPAADGAAIGEGSHLDFKKYCGMVAGLEGGVYFNMGSSVILPEVFLKAVSVCRNLGHKLESFTAVNMDFVEKYRSITNVVKRPTQINGAGYSLIGHHELMIPLLSAAIIEAVDND